MLILSASDLTPVQTDHYRPQTKFAKVMFLQVSVCPRGGGVCGRGEHAWRGGHAWQGGHAWWGHRWHGACMAGGVHGRGRAWQGRHVWQGGHARWGGAKQGDMHGRGHACHAPPTADTTRHSDTVNERAVRILLECIFGNAIDALEWVWNPFSSINPDTQCECHRYNSMKSFQALTQVLTLKICSHVTKFSLLPIHGPLLFNIVSTVTG